MINQPTSIKFNKTKKFGSGTSPDIAISQNNVLVYVESDGINIKYCSGHFDMEHNKLLWNKKEKFTEGDQPSICINKDGFVIECHEYVNYDVETFVYIHYKFGKVCFYLKKRFSFNFKRKIH